MGTSAILPPAKRQFKQTSEGDWSADRRRRKTISRVMDAIVGSVKCFLGALFENLKKGQMMSKPAPLLRENTSRQEDWIQYDCYTSNPIDIATSVTRPKRRDVRNRNVNEEEVVEMEEEEFSSTEQEEETEPNVGKRLTRIRTRRRSRQRTNR